jgi:hypothetical protein
VLTTCQPSTVWCSRERLPAAAAQPAKVRQSCSATDYYIIIINVTSTLHKAQFGIIDFLKMQTNKSERNTYKIVAL